MLNKSLEINGRTEVSISKCEELLEKIILEVGEVGERKHVGKTRWELLFRNPGVMFLPLKLLSTFTQEKRVVQ